jgi:predicted acetyltransferase
MCCNRDNIASARTIIKNGGIFENEVTDGDTTIQRYWIKRNL